MRALRHKHGMSVRQLATALDYHGHSRISEIETGKRVPTVAFVLQVAALFHVTTDQLLQDDLEVVRITYHQDTIAAGLCQPVQGQGMRKFGEKVSRLRKQRGLSYRELAALLETSHSHLINIESGKHNPSVELIVRITRVFGVSFDQLMDDDIELEC